MGLRTSQGINPVAGESERTHTTREGSPCWDFGCYYSYKWKCLKLKSAFRQQERSMDGNALFIPSRGSQTHGVGVNLLSTGVSEQARGRLYDI